MAEYIPCNLLRPFIKNYSVVTIDKDINNEIFYPSGYIDFIIRLPGGYAGTLIDNRYKSTPEIELLGHLTRPTRVTATKGTMVLIIRFYPYACSLFFSDPVAEFTNEATNLYDVYPSDARDLYDRVLEAEHIHEKLFVIESFFIQKLKKYEQRHKKILQVGQMCDYIRKKDDHFDLRNISEIFGRSERYIQKQFVEIVGLQPGKFFASYRFNKSLQLLLSAEISLTEIALECGYYDQAHFIYEFKKFTGFSPSKIRRDLKEKGEEYQKAVNIGL